MDKSFEEMQTELAEFRAQFDHLDRKGNMVKSLEMAYCYFNDQLFKGQLPEVSDVVFTVHRKRGAYGYFCAGAFKTRYPDGVEDILDEEADEIALNPQTFDRSNLEVLSTLLHEMVHLWQDKQGEPTRNGYHNKEWSRKMEEVGLMPSDTGEEGGKRTGQKMTHYIIKGGIFEKVAEEFLEKSGFSIDWTAFIPLKVPSPKSKIKYTCPTCGQNAWAKPEAKLMCGECEEHMKSEEED